MAVMIDEKPSYHGEAKLWECIEKFMPNNVIVYNNREVYGKEFDCCLLIEGCGILIIEVKGWLADKLKVNGVDDILIEGYEQAQRSPKKQARAYRFHLLNKLRKEYNISPIVFDMVCYPFISKEEYRDTRLDIISEEEFTIFKEDMDSEAAFLGKIQKAYSSLQNIPHDILDLETVLKIRSIWEPERIEIVNSTNDKSDFYSIMLCQPLKAVDRFAYDPVDEYFNGTKIVAFIEDRQVYESLIGRFNAGFKQRNLEPLANSLQIGYSKGLKAEAKSVRTFNLELYHITNLSDVCTKEIIVEEGNFKEDELQIVRKVSDLVHFNLQQFLVEHATTEKNILVEAGAGTGKTFSMVSRVAFLCNKKVASVINIEDDLAMVTFTNEAADNMRVRIKQMFTNYFLLTSNVKFLKFICEAENAQISTIHKFALRILQEFSLYTGLGSNFSITSDEYNRSKIYDRYMGEFLKKMADDNENFYNEIPVPVYELKNKLMAFADCLLNKSIDISDIKLSDMGETVEGSLPYFNNMIDQVLLKAEAEYFLTLHKDNNIDLKECIILLNHILRRMKGKIELLKIQYLFIDEFQDTDDVQIVAFQKLQQHVNSQCKFFIVGDLKQSIYRFRGARLSAFKQMKEDSLYEWETFYLTINYRTDSRLLNLYHGLFANMGSQKYLPYVAEEDRLYSNLITEIDDESLLECVPCHSKDKEGFFDTFTEIIKKQVEKLEERAQKQQLSKAERTIAVLVRKNWQVQTLVQAAKKRNLKLEIESGGDLFQLPSTIDLYKLVLALNNSDSSEYLVNFMESNYTDINIEYAKFHGMEKNDILLNLRNTLDKFFLEKMGYTWQEIVDQAYTQPILYVLKNLFDALQPWVRYHVDENNRRAYIANYEYLIERIIRFSGIDSLTLNQVMEYLSINILTGQRQLSREIDTDDAGIHILCTTIHKSKGLEYAAVILPFTDEDISNIQNVKLEANYSENRLMYSVTFQNKVKEKNSFYQENMEISEKKAEETRILYVAMTRAINNCVWFKNLDRHANVSWASLLEE